MLTLMLGLLWTADATRLEEPGAADAVRHAAELIELGRHKEAENILREMLDDPPPPIRAVSDEERIREALAAAEEGKLELARSTLAAVAERNAGVTLGIRASRLLDEMRVIGRRVPTLEPERWLVGRAPETERPRVWLFFETWCPHCSSEVPRFENIARAWREMGVDVVGVTRLSQDTTEADLRSFLGEHALSIPVALDSGSISDALGVSGVPAVAIVADGVVVWRGHPSRFHEGRLRSLTTPSNPAAAP